MEREKMQLRFTVRRFVCLVTMEQLFAVVDRKTNEVVTINNIPISYASEFRAMYHAFELSDAYWEELENV